MKIFIIPQMLAVTAQLLIAQPLKSGLYKVDAHASKINWLAKKVTGTHKGSIGISDGEFHVQSNRPMDVSLRIDIRSIIDADLTDKDSNEKLVATLKGETFFDSDKYPNAAFVSTSIVHANGSLYTVKGKLTIKGITNEISFPATIIINKNRLIANAKIVVDRTKFDIKIRSKSFFENLGDRVIYDNFELDIMLCANAE